MKTALKKNNILKAGFSLVEMLVVIAVIGIMAAIAVPTIGNMTTQAKTNKAKRNAQSAASVWASAQAAGATLALGTNGSTDSAKAIDTLNGGVYGDSASGFGSTQFKVTMSDTERDAAAALLTYNATDNSLTYTP